MAKIKQIFSRQILNSVGNPTIETAVVLTDGAFGVSSSPSGTSIGKYEAVEVRDKDELNGIQNAILNVENIIAPAIVGMEANAQQEIDKKIIALDGTHNKSRLGANATLSVSAAIAKAAAKSSSLPLFVYLREFIKNDNSPIKIPTPCFNLICGGKHANGNLDLQEYLVIPATSKSYKDSLMLGRTIYLALKKNLETLNLSNLTADEGGFSPNLETNQEGLKIIKNSVESLNLRLGFDIFLGLDAAANTLYHEQKYHIKDKSTDMSADDVINFFQDLNKDYHLLYLEDPLAEDDLDGWSKLYSSLSSQTLIVGDDLTATNPYRLQTAVDKKAISGIIIKPNQIGTVTESLAVVEMAKQHGIKIIVSQRMAETNDDFIADFAVAVSADYVKFGATVRGERIAKYNRLLQIDDQIKLF